MSDGYNATKREIEILEMRKENADLRSQLATAQATYLQFCKKHDEKMEEAREALATTKTMISDQMIWNAIVDLETNKTLGEVIDAALNQIAPDPNNGSPAIRS